MALSSAAEAYLATPTPVLAWVLTISPVGGTALRFAEVDLGSAIRGSFSGRITSVSDVRIGYGDHRGGIEALEVRIHVEDLDRALASVLEGQEGGRFYGAPVSLELASTGLAPGASIGLGDWPAIFVGMYDHAEQSRTEGLDLVLRTDDREIQRSLNLPVISAQFAPFAVQPTIGMMAPIVYGLQDSRALVGTVAGTTGSIPTLYLGDYDGTAYRYFVSVAQMFHVERVFKDGVFVSTATWSKYFLDLGPGLFATCIQFASSQGSSRITVDGIGIHPSPEGVSQPPYTTPPAIMRHLLNNFIFRAWRGGDRSGGWFGDSTRLDVASWDSAHAYAVRQGMRASLYIGPNDVKTRSIDLLAEFSKDHGFRLFWTEANTLAIAIRDTATTSVYQTGSQWIDAGRLADPAAIARPRPSRDDADGISRECWRMSESAASAGGGSPEIGAGIARSRATVIRPGGSGINIENQAGRFGPAARYGDRNMMAPSTIKLASPAFGIGQFAGAAGMKDGARVSNWNGHYNGFNTRYDFEQSTGAAQPELKLGRINSRPALYFDGSRYMYSGWGLSSVLTDTAFDIFVVFRAAVITTSTPASPASNHQLFAGNSGSSLGIGLYTSGGLYYVQGWNYSGAFASVALEISLNTWYFVRFRHLSNVLYLSLNNALSESTISSGTTTDVTPVARIGSLSFNGDIAEVQIYSSGDISGSAAWPGGSLVAGLDWEAADVLMRDYGLY